MTEPENLLERWSRRKRQVSDQPDATPAPKPETTEHAAPADGAAPPGAEAALDITDLPSIDSIAAETDVRVFLRKGVPPELTREALRRAWSTDPAIRDFVGLVENGWDFNDPNAMGGFGPIGTDEVARLLTQIIGTPEEGKPAEPSPVAQQDKTPQSRPGDSTEAERSTAQDASAKDDSTALQRTHDVAPRNESEG